MISTTGTNAHAATAASQSTLQQTSKNTIDTGRYEIKGKEDELWIKDRHTNTWVKLWGDPHLKTSDGDKGQFHKENLTFDLQDGTKVTVKVTELNKKGKSYLQSVAVMKGNEAMVMRGLHDGKAGVKIKDGLDAASVDRRFDDGTVLNVGDQVDDLFFAGSGAEIIGGAGKLGNKEHLLDGQGGVSNYDFTQLPAPGEGAPGAINETPAPDPGLGLDGGKNIFEKLSSILENLYNQLDGKGGLLDQMNSLTGDNFDQAKFTEINTNIQRLMNMISAVTTAMSNIEKKQGDMMSTIASNMR